MTTPPPIPKPYRRTGRWAIWVTLTVSAIIAAGLIWYLIFRVSNASAVRKLEANAQQHGEVLTLAELQTKYPSIPDNENAAAPLLALWEKEDPRFWKAFRNNERPLPKRAPERIHPALPFLGNESRNVARATPFPERSRAAADTFLSNNAAHMQAVREALKRPRCRFPVKLADGYAALLPHLIEMKTEAQRFRIAAVTAAERGEIDSAIESIKNVMQVGNALADEPFLIGQLTRIGCFTIAIDATEQLLSRQALSISQLRTLDEMAEKLKMTNALKRSFIAERATTLSVFDMPANASARLLFSDSSDSDVSSQDADGDVFAIALLKTTGLATADRRMVLDAMQRAIALADQETPDALAECERIFENVRKQASRFPPKIFSAMLLPALGRAVDRFASFEGRRRTVVAALGVERYRIAHHGELPPQLHEIVPEFLPAVPSDPFDGQPLRFRGRSKGFVVYSIGMDRNDDGGKERPLKAMAGNFDQTFVIER